MVKEGGESRVLKSLPKGLSNHLNLIKKNKEAEDLKAKTQAQGFQSDPKESTLQSDKIIEKQEANRRKNRQHGWSDSDDNNDDDKWQKMPDKTKPIKKISLSSLKSQSNSHDQEDRISPIVQKPKKKITIQRDASGKIRFEEEILNDPAQKTQVKQQTIRISSSQKPNKQQAQNDYDSFDEEQNNNNNQYSSDERDMGSVSPQRGEQSKGRIAPQVRNLEIKRNNNQSSSNRSTTQISSSQKGGGFIEVSNLPTKIDNQFLNDLLKKEKDHIIDSYRIDDIGRVRLTSRESADRAISILNKRTLYGQQVSAYTIHSEDYEKDKQDNHHLSNRIIKSRR